MAPDSNAPLMFYVFGAFCNLIALTCVTRGRGRKFVGSVIGLALFLVSLGYVYSQIAAGPIDSGSTALPSVINSLLFFIAFGIPGITYTLKARFGWEAGKQ